MSFEADLQGRLDALAAAGLSRDPTVVGGAQGPELTVEGKTVLCFCSNNYLGLAGDERLREAAAGAVAKHGVGAGASRLISGSMDVHVAAERALADMVGLPAARLFSSGYAASLGAIPALVGPGDVIFSDALNHASIIDAARLSKASVHVYRHCDADHLEALLKERRAAAKRALIVSDALFSMDGDCAPLSALRQLADAFDAAVMVDEAHSLGVFGPQGRGLCRQNNVVPDVLLGTLGKALGAAGAFIAGSASLIEFLQNRARSYVFSTAPMPAQAVVAKRAAALAIEADDRRATVFRHADVLRRGLRRQGWNVPPSEGPIVPILIGEPAPTISLSQALLQRGIFIQGIRPPTVPAGTSRLRLVPIATHTPEHIAQTLEIFRELS